MLLKQNLSLTLTSDLVDQIDYIKVKMGLSRSEMIERLIKASLDKQLLEDAKSLSSMSFDDLPSEDDWVILQSNQSICK